LIFSSSPTSPTAASPLSLHDALPIYVRLHLGDLVQEERPSVRQLERPRLLVHRTGEGPLLVAEELVLLDLPREGAAVQGDERARSEEHTSELQSRENLVCRLLLEKKK